MKERIKKIAIALVLLAGIICIGTLMSLFLPLWIRCCIWGATLVWLLWDGSEPEDEDLHNKIERLNDLESLRSWIGSKADYEDLKYQAFKEEEEIVKSIKFTKTNRKN